MLNRSAHDGLGPDPDDPSFNPHEVLLTSYGDDDDKAAVHEAGRFRSEGGSIAKPAGGWSASTKLRLLPLADMIATVPEPVPWIVDRFVMRGGLTLLAGLAGQGKSLVAMAFCIAAAGDHIAELAGIIVEPSRVVIVDAENGRNEIHRRIHALSLSATAADRMAVVEAEGFDLMADLEELDALLGHAKPSLLILDSFRSMWRGDERDEAEVAAVLDPLRNLARRHNVGTLLIHHARRDGTGYRGSGAIAASCELAFLLDRGADDPEPMRRRLRCEKSRPAPEPEPRWLRLATEVELADGVPLVAEAEPFESTNSGRPSVRAEVAEQAVRLIAERGPLKAADVARWLGRDPSDGTVHRALHEAVVDGRLARPDGKHYALASQYGNTAGNTTCQLASQPPA